MDMKIKEKTAFYFPSGRNVFSFFLRLGLKTKKTKIFYLISFLPVLMSLIIKFSQVFSNGRQIEGTFIFSNMIMVFYLQFLILILALFFGTSVCSEEVEGKTLTYLVTRPIPKPAFILGKYSAYTLIVILMVAVGVIFSFVILNVDNLLDFSRYKILLRYMAVLTLGILCYSSFFMFIGTFLKRSILFGLIFSFGWENVVQYFPGSTQRFAIVHYLKSLLPPSSGGRFSFLLFRLEPSSPGMSIFMLFLITGIFLILSCVVFSLKEYILDE